MITGKLIYDCVIKLFFHGMIQANNKNTRKAKGYIKKTTKFHIYPTSHNVVAS